MKNTKKDFIALEKRRLSAVKMFGCDIPQSDIARRFEVSRQAVHIWHEKYKENGKKALLSHKATGRPTKVSRNFVASKLPQILMRGALHYGYSVDMWTTAGIGSIIQKRTGIHYHNDHIRKILHRIGFSWQKPEKRAIERDEDRINCWMKRTWPAIKKKP